MYQSRDNASIIPVLWMTVVFLLCAAFLSCGFIDFREVRMQSYPEFANSILPDPKTNVFIQFDAPVKKAEAESILKISSPDGSVEGNVFWEAGKLIFSPRAPWRPGLRYVLNFSGTVETLDGRDGYADFAVPFFVVSAETQPYLIKFSPADGESVDVEDGGKIHLVFSSPMNRRSVEENFSLEGRKDLIFNWIDDVSVEISTKEKLTPFKSFTWNLTKKALNLAGSTLAKKETGTFFTNKEAALPSVKYLYAAKISPVEGAGYLQSDVGLLKETGLPFGCGIGIRFDKNMDAASVRNAVKIQPGLLGYIDQISGSVFVFIPYKNPTPESEYILTVSKDASDIYGIKIKSEYNDTFKSAINYMYINELKFTSGSFQKNIYRNDIENIKTHKIAVNPAMNFSVIFKWSELWTAEAKRNISRNITLTPVFPAFLGPAALVSVKWLSDDIVEFNWQGVESFESGKEKFYKISIAGMESGTENGKGSYIKEGINIYFEVIK
ncbi:MAG: Ig-like domain-containing protein [Spirochaetaceae bacterium]|jgi:hypothetical protein|nr:Ig-like domain-containing protein [Spirochaetaceae bacterium]